MLEYYRILWLSQNATMEEIIEAYSRLAMKNNPNNWGSEYLFRIIHYAYNEIINNYYNREEYKTYSLNEYIEFEPKSISWEISVKTKMEEDKYEEIIDTGRIYIPSLDEISTEIYLIFKKLRTNPFIIDENFDLVSIKKEYELIQSNKEDNKKLLSFKLGEIASVSPANQICFKICSLYNCNTKLDWFKEYIQVLLVREAAKDIIAKNWGMVLNEEQK
jgi:hypothetical protein